MDQHPLLFRSLFAAYPDALLVVDAEGRIVLANPAAAALLDYGVDALVGLPVDALVPDAIRPRHAAWRSAYAANPRARPMGTQMELVARRGDGSEVMVEIALSPLQDHGLPYVVAAIRGIGAYPRVRQALQRARYSEHVAQFGRLAVDARDPQVLVEQAPRVAADALEIENVVLLLLEPNRQESRVAAGFGLGPDEQPGARLPLAIDPAPGWASTLAVPLSDRGHPLGTLLLRSRTPQRFGDDERRFVDLLCSLLATSLQRAHSEEALNHSQRLESVGQLTGGIAHDFNNLLTVISGNLQVLEELPALAQDGFGQQLVAAAARASRRGAELTGKLLAFSRRQVLQPAAVDVGTLLDALADMLRRTLDQRIRIVVHAERGCPPVLADPGQLESALLNIAINARDAMPEGGTLAFACRALPPHSAELPVELAESDMAQANYVEIAVADSGVGMSEAVKERAFEPFFTTKEAGRGTGLGLSTVYGFARQSRGAVQIDSAPGAGTTLRLLLPVVPGSGDDAAADDEPDAALPAGLKVMLVEDDPEVRQVVQHFLAALGCRVDAHASGEEALAALQPGAGIEVLLTDIALGAGLRGTELAEQARARLPGLPVLLMSGYSSALLDAPPGWPLLRKPYTRAELARALARVIAPR
jgi:PAS domain S-box-containing protein